MLQTLFFPRTADDYYAAGVRLESIGQPAKAVISYRKALSFDPSHTDAIAALGRLQFNPPEQPLIAETRKVPHPVCEVTIEIRNPCNFRCFYCVAAGHNNEPVQPLDLARIETIYQNIGDKLIVTAFDCGGGEPTVHPQCKELIELCARFGAVSIPSNNSQDPTRWLPQEHARRIMIRSTLHPEAERNLDRYLQHARYLIDSGVTFVTLYVTHPTRIHRIPELKRFFAEQKIRFVPVAFVGEYEGKLYPYAYTEDDQRLLGSTDPTWWGQKIQPHTNRIRNFRGIPCLAGHTSLYVTRGGELRRCLYDQKPIPSPLSKAEPCGVSNCGCGLALERLNYYDLGDFYQTWATRAGKDSINISFERLALRHGYQSWNDGVAREQEAMYDALMSAYGKDEFPEP